MHRVDDPSAVATLPAILTPGTPGYFTRGSSTTGQHATIVTQDWANAVQEEICYVVEQSGLVLSKTDRTQLYRAITALGRRRLTAAQTFYVSPTGNDGNDGQTAGTAWASITHAYNYIRDRIDTNGFQTAIQLADGTYPGAVIQYPIVGLPPVIAGNAAAPQNVIINNPAGPAILVGAGAAIFLQWLTVQADGSGFGDYASGGAGIFANGGTAYLVQGIRFGVCSSTHMGAQYGGGITMSDVGQAYTIAGGAPFHMAANGGGYISTADAHVTLTGAPAFTVAFCSASGGQVNAWGMTFTGTATGVRYFSSFHGLIQTQGGGPNYFPGSDVGYVDAATYGLYV